MSGNRLILGAAILVLGLTFFFQLGNLPFFGGDEPRYARIGEEMLTRGEFVTPTLNFIPWLEKPPLLFWLEAASYRVWGVSEWSARFPVAVLSVLTILACSSFMGRITNRRTGVLSLFILSTTPLFFAFGRAASTDMPLSALFVMALLCAYLGGTTGRWTWAALSGLALGLAILAKGIVAPVLFAGVLVLSSLLARRWLWNYRQTLIATAVASVVSLPWYWLAWEENGYNFITTFFVNHHIARYLTPVHRHTQPFWFYLGVILLGFYPWAFFLGSNVARIWRSRVRPRTAGISAKPPLETFLWVWVLVPVIFFTPSSSKLAGYILPVFPALAMLAALEWDRYLSSDIIVCKHVRKEVAGLAAFSILIVLTLVFGSFFAYGTFLHGLYLGACILVGISLAFRAFHKKNPERLLASLVSMMTLFAVLAYGFAAPAIGSYHSVKSLVTAVKPHLSDQEPLIQYRCFHHTALYYSDYQATPDAIPDIEALHDHFRKHPQDRYFLLVKKGGLEDLREEFDLTGVTSRGSFYIVEMGRPPALE